jgi:hypothetical protein
LPDYFRSEDYRAANLLIHRQGADALIEAARSPDMSLERGDPAACLVWFRIRQAIVALPGALDADDASRIGS